MTRSRKLMLTACGVSLAILPLAWYQYQKKTSPFFALRLQSHASESQGWISLFSSEYRSTRLQSSRPAEDLIHAVKSTPYEWQSIPSYTGDPDILYTETPNFGRIKIEFTVARTTDSNKPVTNINIYESRQPSWMESQWDGSLYKQRGTDERVGRLFTAWSIASKLTRSGKISTGLRNNP